MLMYNFMDIYCIARYPRLISNTVGAIGATVENSPESHSMLFTLFGQFIDHDAAKTRKENEDDKEESMNIDFPNDDPFYDQLAMNFLPFKRSNWVYDCNDKRDIVNSETPYLDASTIYGTNENKVKNVLRSGVDGKLKVNHNNIFAQQDDNPQGGFLRPDGRVGSNYILFAIHVMFHRLHNYIADQVVDTITQGGQTLTDDEIFEIARNMNIAIIQRITYDEFLPQLIGETLPAYDPVNGYDVTEKPTEFIEVNSAAFRYGHSMLATEIVDLKLGSNQKRATDKLGGGKFKNDDEWTEKMIRGSSKTVTKKRGV